MKKKIAKIILSSGTLTTIAFIIVLIPVLMIMDFFGANITDDYVENNAEYASEYKRVLNQNLRNGKGYVPLNRILYFYLAARKQLIAEAGSQNNTTNYPDPSSAIKDKNGFVISAIIFGCAIVLLVTHAQTGLTVASIGVFVGVVTLVVAGKGAIGLLKKLDYETLLFFVGLFVVVGGLEQTGVLEIMAGFIGDISGGNQMIMIAIILWISAIASAFVDNIPFAATMIPIIRTLAATQGVDLPVLAWTLAMGTDIGGSATPIGASANVVGIATAGKEGYVIRWGRYCKLMVPATIIVLFISMVILYLRYL